MVSFGYEEKQWYATAAHSTKKIAYMHRALHYKRVHNSCKIYSSSSSRTAHDVNQRQETVEKVAMVINNNV